MALFDFLKKKQPQAVSPAETPVQKTHEPYLGDLSKTAMIYELVQTPKAERDEKWRQNFLESIAQASFRCGNPQVITGPDGFPYFQLFLPEPNQNFQCYVIDKMKDDFLLPSGYGVVINPGAAGADWVLSYGDILNLHLNNTFYTTTETPFSKKSGDETIAKEEQVMIGQPADTILPAQTRHIIADFLKMNGVKSPKVLLMMRPATSGNVVSQDLVFNLTPADFKDENTYRAVMQMISWFLPRHYSFAGMDEKTLGDGFMDL